MKLYLVNAASGFKPVSEEDQELKRKLKSGEVYECEIRLARNYEFLKKAHALVNLAWEYLPERQTEGFRTKENFRKYLTVAAGFTDVFYSPTTKSWQEAPRSWSFEKMSEEEFQELYEAIYGVIFKVFGRFIPEEEFKTNLANF